MLSANTTHEHALAPKQLVCKPMVWLLRTEASVTIEKLSRTKDKTISLTIITRTSIAIRSYSVVHSVNTPQLILFNILR